jgi:hypothetical protein
VIALLFALGAFLLHVATTWRYGYFRDELYFIACAKHLAVGYVDQPPLVAFAAWLSRPFGYALPALRLLPALSNALAAALAVRMTRDLGGRRFAQVLSGATVALMPAYLALGNVLTTTSFESLSWTLVVYCILRIVEARDREADATPWWIAASAAVAFGLYAKYSMGSLAAALSIGLLCTPDRRVLATTRFPLAIGLCLLLVLPNLWWQAAHGWPFFTVLAGDATHRPSLANGIALETANLATNARAFLVEQFIYTNPAAAPVWVAALIAPFTWPRLRRLRFLAVAYIVLCVAAVLLGAKGYYIIGIYASLFAAGALVIERAAQPVRVALFAIAASIAIAAMPLSLPILPLRTFIAYTKVLGMTGRHGKPAHLVEPLYAEQFGWNRLARDVASFYYVLPPETRRKTAVYADTYADAGAIDFFGRRFGLPDAISSQNSYWLWGTHGYDGKTLIAIGATRVARLERYYESCKLVTVSNEPLKWIVEGPSPIYLCTGPRIPFARIWPRLRWYGA